MKAQATMREIGLAALIMVALLVYLYFSMPNIPNPNPPVKEECRFDSELACSSSVFLRRGSSKLELAISQNTGKPINITSVVCTKKRGIPIMVPLNNSILIASGSKEYVSGSTTGNEVICTDADGKSIPDASLGNVYEGRLYITYIEVKTWNMKLVNGTITAKYS